MCVQITYLIRINQHVSLLNEITTMNQFIYLVYLKTSIVKTQKLSKHFLVKLV